MESTRDAWGVCVIAGWSETEEMNVLVEKLLMGRTLKGTYFGGRKTVNSFLISFSIRKGWIATNVFQCTSTNDFDVKQYSHLILRFEKRAGCAQTGGRLHEQRAEAG